jgi:hypothetical protein
MLKTKPLAATLHTTLVMTLPWAGQTALKQIVTHQCLKTLRILHIDPHTPFHGNPKIVIDNPTWHSPKEPKGPYMGIKK